MTTPRPTPLPDGPYEVTGALEITGPGGEPIRPPAPQARRVYPRRCGHAASTPFCDGSHARTGWRADAGGAGE